MDDPLLVTNEDIEKKEISSFEIEPLEGVFMSINIEFNI